MKIKLKLNNISGDSPIKEFKTVSEAEKYLNEINYYSTEKVELSACFNELQPYDKHTRLSHLMRDAVNYGEGHINVHYY